MFKFISILQTHTSMTIQAQEKLIYYGETLFIESYPLAPHLFKLEVKPKLFPPSSACWRGYVGTLELIEDKLYLVDLKGCTSNNREYWEVAWTSYFPIK